MNETPQTISDRFVVTMKSRPIDSLRDALSYALSNATLERIHCEKALKAAKKTEKSLAETLHKHLDGCDAAEQKE